MSITVSCSNHLIPIGNTSLALAGYHRYTTTWSNKLGGDNPHGLHTADEVQRAICSLGGGAGAAE